MKKIVGIFPEGTRVRGGGLAEPKKGVAYFALKSGAPVLPVGIIITGKKSGFRQRAVISIGRLIEADAAIHHSCRDLSRLIMEQSRELAGTASKQTIAAADGKRGWDIRKEFS